MTKVAEYRDIRGEALSQRSILAQAHSSKVRGTVKLVAATAGWEPAGSMARWTDGYYAVHYMVDGAVNGRRYRELMDAQAHYDRLTAERS